VHLGEGWLTIDLTPQAQWIGILQLRREVSIGNTVEGDELGESLQ
jgi:hypothetical protein